MKIPNSMLLVKPLFYITETEEIRVAVNYRPTQ